MSDIDFIQQITTETAEARRKRLASALINSPFSPPGYQHALWQGLQASAYHQLTPYPLWAFSEWKTEERGPLPRCMPLARSIVRKGAEWLFGRQIQINVPGNKELEASFRKAWLKNKMRTRLQAAAERGGVQGGIVLKWSYDETAETPLCFQILSVLDETRLFYDPHDRNSLLMARVQYPVWNPQNGEWYLYREEWTDTQEVHYKPLPCKFVSLWQSFNGRRAEMGSVPYVNVNGTSHDPDTYKEWEITSQAANPFGMIPLVPMRNIDIDGAFGIGDLWTDTSGGMFRVLDRINLAYHLQDRSNQFDSSPIPVFIDAKEESDELAQPLAPGEAISIKSDAIEGENRQAKVQLIEPAMKSHEPISEYALELRKMLLDAVGSVMLDSAEITNKGNLTQAVLTQMYAPLIGATEAKRETYGENGICQALEKVAVSLQNLSSTAPVKMEGIKAVNSDNEETFDCQLVWPDYFALTEEEKQARVTRVQLEIDSGLMTHERAIEIVAKTEDIDDIDKLKKELEGEMQHRQEMKQAELETAQGTAKQAMNPPQPAGGR